MGCPCWFWGALGALPSGMLQPPWHVTAAPACYRLQNRLGYTAKPAKQKHLVSEVLHFGICNFKTAKTAQDGSWEAVRHALGTLLGCSWGFWGALGALPSGMLQPRRHVTAAPACYRTLFSYNVCQAGLLHAALGSRLRLSSSLSNLSCLIDSPSGRFFPMLYGLSIDFTLTNRT